MKRLLTAMILLTVSVTDTAADGVDLVRDVRPVLQRHCDRCHGAKRQKNGLRLDIRLEALRGGDGYGPAIVPAHPED